MVVGVDNDLALAARVEAVFDWLTVAVNKRPPGDSGTRPRVAEMVTAPLTAFLDDDETADPFWLHELTGPIADLADPYVVGTGGQYRDAWVKDKSAWFPSHFSWVVGGAYDGLPTVTSEVSNVWSGNMAVRTQAFRAVHGVRTDFGNHGIASHPEDTDLCIRIPQANGGHWMYVPSAVIDHEVPASRSSLNLFFTRCYTEGAGKALTNGNFYADDVIATEGSDVWRTAWCSLRSLTAMRWVAFRQGMARLCGLASTVIGFAVATLSLSMPATRKDANVATGHLGTSASGVLMAPFTPLDVTGGAA